MKLLIILAVLLTASCQKDRINNYSHDIEYHEHKDSDVKAVTELYTRGYYIRHSSWPICYYVHNSWYDYWYFTSYGYGYWYSYNYYWECN